MLDVIQLKSQIDAGTNYDVKVGIKLYYKDKYISKVVLIDKNGNNIDISFLSEEQQKLIAKFGLHVLSDIKDKIHFSLIKVLDSILSMPKI